MQCPPRTGAVSRVGGGGCGWLGGSCCQIPRGIPRSADPAPGAAYGVEGCSLLDPCSCCSRSFPAAHTLCALGPGSCCCCCGTCGAVAAAAAAAPAPADVRLQHRKECAAEQPVLQHAHCVRFSMSCSIGPGTILAQTLQQLEGRPPPLPSLREHPPLETCHLSGLTRPCSMALASCAATAAFETAGPASSSCWSAPESDEMVECRADAACRHKR